MSFNQMKNAYQKTMKQSPTFNNKQDGAKKNDLPIAKPPIQPTNGAVQKNDINTEKQTERKSAVSTLERTESKAPKPTAKPKVKGEESTTNAGANASKAQKQANVYKQNALSTASPGDLTLLLYNGCLKFIDKADKAIDEKDFTAKNKFIIRAQDIIRELMVTLKTDTDVGKSMLSLYDFINSRLIDANTKNDKVALAEARDFVVEFRDTWKQVIQINRKEQHGVGNEA
jgi:flagellar protein FliS